MWLFSASTGYTTLLPPRTLPGSFQGLSDCEYCIVFTFDVIITFHSLL